MRKKERMSNMELARIIAMMLIVINHIFYNVIMYQLSPTNNLYLPGEMFNNLLYYKKLTLVEFSLAFGKIGNTLFILITGYFLINKSNIDVKKQSKKLLLQIIYCVIGLTLSSFIVSLIHPSFKGLITIRSINDCGWFAGYYLLIILLANLFINKRLNSLNKNQYLSLLIIGFALMQIGWSREIINSVFSSVVINGLWIYSLGGYLKKYKPLKKYKISFLFLMILVMFLLIALTYRNYVQLEINKAIISGATSFYQTFIRYDDYHFAPIIIGICLFEIFSRMKIKTSVFINYIGSSTFMIFLLHDNEFDWEILRHFNFINLYYNNVLLFMVYIVLIVLIIFIISIICYYIYNKLLVFYEKYLIKYICNE